MPSSFLEHLLGSLQTTEGLELELLAMGEEHIEQLVAIEAVAHASPWSAKLFSDCLTGRQQCFVAFAQNNKESHLVAYIVLTLAGPDAEILNLAVAEKWQKKGIGRSLLRHTVHALKHCSEIIYLEVRESNATAIALYDSEGFVEVGVRSGYYPAKKGREDAIIYAYTLTDVF